MHLVASEIMRKVIDWGCLKPREMSFLDFVTDSREESQLSSYERILLATCDHSDLNVAQLYALIPLVCENLDTNEFHARGKAISNNVEGLLRSIYDTRKEIVYSSSVLFRTFEDLFTNLIIAAGKLYSIDGTEVNYEVATARCKIFQVF